YEIQSKPPYDKRSFYISKVGFPTLISCPVFGVHYTHSTLGSGYTLESELMKGVKGVGVRCHEICNSCDKVTS
ncbi:MAG: hypothetical protein M1511_15775, partial [Deltaproteobacteria bacterium]|nr:hypothetical protein [Deltaproteobacteria bacterium]